MSDTEEIFHFEFNDIVIDFKDIPILGARSGEGVEDYIPFNTFMSHEIDFMKKAYQEIMLDAEIAFLKEKPFTERTPDEIKKFYRRLIPGRFRLTLERIKE